MTPRPLFRTLALLLFVGLSFPPLHACIWDTDTLKTEQSRFPGVFEMITGQFPRHSKEFYEWRSKNAKARADKNRDDFAAYDDWAVAEHKLGHNPEAIRIMTQALNRSPERYETLSNLGTFYLFEGDLKKCRELLQHALRINPNAHFGREKYQLWLTEFLLFQKGEMDLTEFGVSATDPEAGDEFVFKRLQTNFAIFVTLRLNEAAVRKEGLGEIDTLTEAQRKETLTAITGMMRFAQYDHPVLLEALGDVLCAGNPHTDATRLGALAYRQASLAPAAPAEQERLRIKSNESLSGFRPQPEPSSITSKLEDGLVKNRELQSKVRTDELAWIRAGKDAQAEFEKKYLK